MRKVTTQAEKAAFEGHYTFQPNEGLEGLRAEMDAFKDEADKLGDFPVDEFKHRAAALIGGIFEIQRLMLEDMDIKTQMLAIRIKELMALQGKER